MRRCDAYSLVRYGRGSQAARTALKTIVLVAELGPQVIDNFPIFASLFKNDGYEIIF